MEENFIIEKKSEKNSIYSIVFLGIIIFLTLSLFLFNYYLKNGNNNISLEVEKIEKNISSIKQSKNIQIYELLNDYKTNIDKLELNNNILEYLKHLSKIEQKYGINFSGFSLGNGEIKTKVLVRKLGVRTNSAYEKVSRFISEYRDDKNSMFDLEFINSFDGMDEIKFDLKFKLKANLKNTLEINNKENE